MREAICYGCFKSFLMEVRRNESLVFCSREDHGVAGDEAVIAEPVRGADGIAPAAHIGLGKGTCDAEYTEHRADG